MYRAIIKCEKAGIKIHYTDTDSLIISRPKSVELPLELDNSVFGKYKKEINEPIETFYSLGPKNYCIRTTLNTQIKCRGFFLKNSLTTTTINEKIYQEFIKALLEEEEALKTVIPQFKISYDKKAAKLFSRLQLKSFCSHVFNKRVLLKYDHTQKPLTYSLPFGYDETVLNKVIQICRNK